MHRVVDNIETITGDALHREIMLLPQWRRDVVMRYKFESGKRESALAFRLLQQMVHDYDSAIEETDALEFTVNEHGKPSLRSYPHVHFNLSHCKRAVACAVSDKPIGIDVECTGRYKHSLAEYCMSPEEVQWIESGDDADVRFTKLWTQKEALVKLLGTGITDDIKTILAKYDGQVDYATEYGKGYVCTVVKYTPQKQK